MNWTDRITKLTDLARHGGDPMHARLRALLRGQGVDVAGALLANLMPDGRGRTTGVVVTGEGRVYEFDVSHRGRPLEDAELTTWRECTEAYHAHGYRDAVTAALAMLDRGDGVRSMAAEPEPARGLVPGRM
jgi:hypothetical protein